MINKIEVVGVETNATNEKNVIHKMIKNGQSILKFAYLGEGANAWDKIRNNSEFLVGNREINALKEISSHLNTLRQNRPINFIHLGSGNGIEIPIFAEMFNFGKQDTYTGADISNNLLEILIKNHSNFLSETVGSCFFFQTDLEVADNIKYICDKLNSVHKAVNIIAASGEGTLLSNHDVLKNISQSLDNEDYALFSIDGIAEINIQTVCSEYDKQITRDFVIHGLKYAKSIGAIHSNISGEFNPTYYDKALQQIVISYKLTGGTEVVLLRSFKPSDEQIVKNIFGNNGLEVVYMIKTKDNAFGILCRKLNK